MVAKVITLYTASYWVRSVVARNLNWSVLRARITQYFPAQPIYFALLGLCYRFIHYRFKDVTYRAVNTLHPGYKIQCGTVEYWTLCFV